MSNPVDETPASSLPAPRDSAVPEPDDHLTLFNPDDVLVIPDDTREELATSVPSNQSTEKDAEQCVPRDESEDHRQFQSHDLILDEDSLFVEDGFIPLDPCQPTPCEADHVVPKFEFEE